MCIMCNRLADIVMPCISMYCWHPRYVKSVAFCVCACHLFVLSMLCDCCAVCRLDPHPDRSSWAKDPQQEEAEWVAELAAMSQEERAAELAAMVPEERTATLAAMTGEGRITTLVAMPLEERAAALAAMSPIGRAATLAAMCISPEEERATLAAMHVTVTSR